MSGSGWFTGTIRRGAALLVAASIGLIPIGAVRAASWSQEDLVDGWENSAPALAVRSDDKTGVVYERFGTDPGILYQTDASGSWDETRITSGDDWVPDLAFDASDHAHVAFARFGTTPGIYYATDATGSWATSLAWADDAWAPSIAVDGAGKIHIAYASTNFTPGTFYLTNASGDWVRTQISSGTYDAEPSLALDGNGAVHVAFARYQPESRGLYYATNASGTWTSGRITTGSDDQPSLVIDSSDHPHIAFRAASGTGISYMENTSGSWQAEAFGFSFQGGQEVGPPSLAIAPDGAFHVVFGIYPNVGYGPGLHHWVGSFGSWSGSADIPSDNGLLWDFEPTLGFDSTGAVELAFTRQSPATGVMLYEFGCCPTMLAASSEDGPPALGVDGSGDGRLAFARHNDDPAGNVEFGTAAGSAWSFERIGNHAGSDRAGLARAPDGSWRVVVGSYYGSNESASWVADTVLPSGAAPAVAVDGAGHAHISFTDTSGPYWVLHYRSNETGTWVDEALTGAYDVPGFPPAIAVDGAGKSHVAFVAGGHLWYTTNKTGTWSEPAKVTLPADDNAPGVGNPAIAIDAAGKVHLAWDQVGGGAGTYYGTNASGTWVRARLTRTYAGEAPSIALDASGKVYVAVARAYWAANPGIYLISNRTGAWVVSQVVQTFGSTGTPLVVGPGDLVRIAFDNDDWGISILDQTSLTATTLRDPAAILALRRLGRLPGMVDPAGPAGSGHPARAPSGPTAPQVSGGAGFGHSSPRRQPPGARPSSVRVDRSSRAARGAVRGGRCAGGARGPAAGRHDQGDREHDDPAGEDGPRLDRLAEQDPGQDERDDRVHVGVRRDLRERRDPEEPDVGREADEAAHGREVDEPEPGPGGDGRDVERGQLPDEDRADEQERSATDHLEPGRGERTPREDRPMRREERAAAPADRRDAAGRRSRTCRTPGRHRCRSGRRGRRRRPGR